MATINPAVTIIDDHVVRFLWETLTTANNDGAPIPVSYMDFADRTVQVTGVTGGGNIRIQGSNDLATYATLNDPQGLGITINSGIKQILEVTPLMRPVVIGGDGTTDFDVSIVCRRSRSGQEL